MTKAMEPFSPQDMKHRRARAVAMALILVGLVVLFFVTTIVRLGGGVSLRGF
ncbi:MAG: hypothetical protein H7X89_10160 [Rhizobiales bacterium]|nr:hypothetical protein [Hyphomicrobiales bacterium]